MEQVENRRILIADDEPEILKGYSRILNPERIADIQSSRTSENSTPPMQEFLRFELTQTNSGEGALNILLENLKNGIRFAGAIVDVRMPGKMDGLQFVQEAWKNDEDLQVIIVTAYQDRSVDEIHRLFKPGFQDKWDYLNKPFTAGEIVQKARHLVSSWNRQAREKEHIQQIKNQHQALISQEKLVAVGRLARSIGHEFGNILLPMITDLDLLKEQVMEKLKSDAKEGDKGIELAFEEMIESVSLGSRICQDLLVFARENYGEAVEIKNGVKAEIQAGAKTEAKAEAYKDEYNLDILVDKALRLLRHEITKRDLKVRVDILAGLKIKIEQSKMIQVLINVIKNATEALADGGSIDIVGKKLSDHFILLEISDNGSGISQEDLSKVFQPLFTTKGIRGNGLGLSVCKQVMEEVGGEISISSVPKKGTTVRLKIRE